MDATHELTTKWTMILTVVLHFALQLQEEEEEKKLQHK